MNRQGIFEFLQNRANGKTKSIYHPSQQDNQIFYEFLNEAISNFLKNFNFVFKEYTSIWVCIRNENSRLKKLFNDKNIDHS